MYVCEVEGIRRTITPVLFSIREVTLLLFDSGDKARPAPHFVTFRQHLFGDNSVLNSLTAQPVATAVFNQRNNASMSAIHRRLLRTSTNCLTRVSSVFCASCQHNHVRKFHLNGGGQPSQAELTSKRYPTLKRGAFATLTDADVSSLGRLVSGRVITEESELDGYNTDWLKTVRGWLVHGSTRPVTQFVSGTGWLVGAFKSLT